MTSSLVGSEMCIRDSALSLNFPSSVEGDQLGSVMEITEQTLGKVKPNTCLLYTSDAADDM
eukprot:8566454-Prorocentrum_lima.AAC.1